jgi:rhamnulokinase
MNVEQVFLAIDLGASSGRVVAGVCENDRLSLVELHRFPCESVDLPSGSHWNFPAILTSIKKGLRVALKAYGDRVVSLGVDTWGVDYGLINEQGDLLGLPFQYRDRRTDGMMAVATDRLSAWEIYARTGIQPIFFNTLYQLLAESRANGIGWRAGTRLLFMPDLVNYFLSGRQTSETSIAGTSQLLQAKTQCWDLDLLSRMEIPARLFGELVQAGTSLGPLLPELLAEIGSEVGGEAMSSRLQVISVGSHDTASAVAGVPALEEEPVFLSSGTWSLMGRELSAPVLTEECFQAGFSNEAGVFGTTRLLKNIAGMWLLQECKRQWDVQGLGLDYDQLIQLARQAETFAGQINPDATIFQAPHNMLEAIAQECSRTGLHLPQTPGEVTRLILESLAAKYAETKLALEKITARPITKIYIVGGGSQNLFLNQLAADATGCEIVAGPVEATSLGNILMQMVAAGAITSLQEGRALIARSFVGSTFYPRK